MTILRKYPLLYGVATVGIAVGVIGGVAVGTALAAPQQVIQHTQYEVNQAGETFGSAALAEELGVEPDLISVELADGSTGYVRATDLNGPVPKSPEDAAALSSNAKDRKLPVYTSDGTTVTGEFVVQAAVSDPGNLQR